MLECVIISAPHQGESIKMTKCQTTVGHMSLAGSHLFLENKPIIDDSIKL